MVGPVSEQKSRIISFSQSLKSSNFVIVMNMDTALKYMFAIDIMYSITPVERPPSPATIPLIRPYFV